MITKPSIYKDHVLPNFLGIGVMRGGTTWLYKVLKTHPEIYLYQYIKELHFFDHNYSRGLDWYKQFFPTTLKAKKIKAIGEITPNYIFDENAPKRVAKILPNTRLILILRNPVDRALSQYKYAILNEGIKNSFEQYSKELSSSIERGFYVRQIKNWLNFFPRDRILILIFEEVMKNPEEALRQIAEFLNVKLEGFNLINLAKTVNPSSNVPRLHIFFLIFHKFRIYLKRKGLYNVDSMVAKIFLKYKSLFRVLSFGMKKNIVRINPSIKKQLYLDYKQSNDDLENLIGKDLSIWTL